jgi:ubiquinone/menaquinone biosynthesis C-methylase UbiE
MEALFVHPSWHRPGVAMQSSTCVDLEMSQRVDYDRVADVYESRYLRNDYSGVEQALAAFVAGPRIDGQLVLEVGCGGGHWLRWLGQANVPVVGLDPAAGMLKVARSTAGSRHLIRGRAEALPLVSASCRRLFCVNALHHFDDPVAFFREARRLLNVGGGLLTIGLDPHTGQDEWWIYEYFPEALIADRRRYLPAGRIRELMTTSGFDRCQTRVIQHKPRELTVHEAMTGGFMNRTSTSQLMVISESEYEAGLKRIHEANAASDGAMILRSNLRLYGTTGWAT